MGAGVGGEDFDGVVDARDGEEGFVGVSYRGKEKLVDGDGGFICHRAKRGPELGKKESFYLWYGPAFYTARTWMIGD